MVQKTIGKSKEDYLKAILIVLKEHGACRNVDVSIRLNKKMAKVSCDREIDAHVIKGIRFLDVVQKVM